MILIDSLFSPTSDIMYDDPYTTDVLFSRRHHNSCAPEEARRNNAYTERYNWMNLPTENTNREHLFSSSEHPKASTQLKRQRRRPKVQAAEKHLRNGGVVNRNDKDHSFRHTIGSDEESYEDLFGIRSKERRRRRRNHPPTPSKTISRNDNIYDEPTATFLNMKELSLSDKNNSDDISSIKIDQSKRKISLPVKEMTKKLKNRVDTVVVEDASDSEDDDYSKSIWRNRLPSPGEWMEPIESL